METASNDNACVSDVTNCVESLDDHAPWAAHRTQYRQFDRVEDRAIPDDMQDGRSVVAKVAADALRIVKIGRADRARVHVTSDLHETCQRHSSRKRAEIGALSRWMRSDVGRI
jgi:hypothetical protein